MHAKVTSCEALKMAEQTMVGSAKDDLELKRRVSVAFDVVWVLRNGTNTKSPAHQVEKLELESEDKVNQA